MPGAKMSLLGTFLTIRFGRDSRSERLLGHS